MNSAYWQRVLRKIRRALVTEAAGRIVSSTGHALPRLALTRDEAAASLGTSRDYLDEHIRPGLHVVRLGRRVLVPVRELERWLDLNASRALGDER